MQNGEYKENLYMLQSVCCKADLHCDSSANKAYFTNLATGCSLKNVDLEAIGATILQCFIY